MKNTTWDRYADIAKVDLEELAFDLEMEFNNGENIRGQREGQPSQPEQGVGSVDSGNTESQRNPQPDTGANTGSPVIPQ